MNIPEGNPGLIISQNYQLIFSINHQASSLQSPVISPSGSDQSNSKTGSKSVPDCPAGLLKHYSLLWITVTSLLPPHTSLLPPPCSPQRSTIPRYDRQYTILLNELHLSNISDSLLTTYCKKKKMCEKGKVWLALITLLKVVLVVNQKKKSYLCFLCREQ